MGEAWKVRPLHHVLLLQGDDGEIGPRGLPGESVSVQGVSVQGVGSKRVGMRRALGMPEEGHRYERDTFSFTYACLILSSLSVGTSRSPWP